MKMSPMYISDQLVVSVSLYTYFSFSFANRNGLMMTALIVTIKLVKLFSTNNSKDNTGTNKDYTAADNDEVTSIILY